MKTKVVDYDDIVTFHYGNEFNHGEIIYSDYINNIGDTFLNLKINVGLCILPDEQENFLKEITELVNKYAK